jgi:2,3-bisphosphoglycerate-independent phosphoglycerate mutase
LSKFIYILLDGVGDLPNSDLNHLTPLEAAYTPNLDSLARKGSMGLVYTVGKDISPESDIAVFCMLGYDFSSNYFGRGVVEAVGLGMDFRNGDLALRANFATSNKEKIIIDRRAGRNISQSEAKELSEEINKIKLSHGATFNFVPSIAHRAALKIRIDGQYLSDEIDNTDPAYSRVGGIGIAKQATDNLNLQDARPLSDSKSASLSADLVNEFTTKVSSVITDHKVNLDRVNNNKLPANVLLLRDAGNTLPDIKSMNDRFGIGFASLLDMPVEKGVAKITGMSEHSAGGIHDYEIKANTTLDLLNDYDGVYVHLKGPDEPGHDGDAKRKTKVVEQIDKDFFGILMNKVDIKKTTMIISADHSTPCVLKGHSADPVPVLFSGKKAKNDSCCRFTEKEGRKGSLGTMYGKQVLPSILN